MNIYKNKIVTILGAGITGISCIDFFIKKKSIINIIDSNEKNKISDNIKYNINIYLGNKNFYKILCKSDYIIISPGISIKKYNLKKISYNYKNIKILNDIDIFLLEIKNYDKIIAITGTNGKSTVVELIYKILIENNKKVFLGGNIGIPLLKSLNNEYDYYVLELSSFQLKNLNNKFRSYISVILNIKEDHLDKHKNFKDYKKSKFKILGHTKNYIYNIDDKNTFPDKIKKNINYISFGNYGDYNTKNIDSKIFLYYKYNLLLKSTDINLIGLNNCYNILVSIAVTDLLCVDKHIQLNVIKNFKNLKFRFNISKINTVLWINDSKSTNLDSTIFAIENIKSYYKYNKLILILGGNAKGVNFNILNKIIEDINIKIYCYGKDGNYIYEQNKKISYLFDNLKNLFENMKKIISNNDIVLFSPGCSSLDQYKNYIERGNEFNSLIKKYYNNE